VHALHYSQNNKIPRTDYEYQNGDNPLIGTKSEVKGEVVLEKGFDDNIKSICVSDSGLSGLLKVRRSLSWL